MTTASDNPSNNESINAEQIEIVLDRCEEIAYKIRTAVNTIDRETRISYAMNPTHTHANQYEIDVIADAILTQSCEGFKGCVVSEEQPIDKDALQHNSLWLIVDPIDGSTNASKGLGYWSFSAALVSKGVVVGGVVVDQTTGNVYRASGIGGVSYKNVKTGIVDNLMDINITNLTPGTIADNLNSSTVNFNSHVGPPMPFRHLRNLGSSALAICDVARSALDLYVDDKDVMLNPWDYLAAEYIAKMAGATVKRRDAEGILVSSGIMAYRSFSLDEVLVKIFPEYFIN